MATEFEKGVLIGLLVGEGHFGGDGRQPQVTLRMHVRHEAIFRWLERTFPGGKLYGPYHHDGRHYFQWMARGSYLRDHLLPVLAEGLSPELDAPSHRTIRGDDAALRRPAADATGPEPSRTRSVPDRRKVAEITQIRPATIDPGLHGWRGWWTVSHNRLEG